MGCDITTSRHAIWTRTPETRLGGERSDAVALGVNEPAARGVRQERLSVLRKDNLLRKLEVVDRGVAADAHPVPSSEQPGKRRALGSEVGRDFEHLLLALVQLVDHVDREPTDQDGDGDEERGVEDFQHDASLRANRSRPGTGKIAL